MKVLINTSAALPWGAAAPSTALALCLGLCAGPTTARADESIVDPEDVAQAAIEAAKAPADAEGADTPPEGWDYALSVGANGAANMTRNVVGTPADGWTYQLGAVVNGRADWRHDQHSIQNNLRIQETYSRSPLLESFVKSADSMIFDSTYLFRTEKVDWLGPFGRFKLTTSIFPGYEVFTDEGVTTNLPGYEAVIPQEKVPLTSAFEPLVMRQSGGLFANPLEKKALTVKAKLGAGLLETLTQDGYVKSDDATTAVVEYTQLEDSTQAGGEASLDLAGSVKEDVNWGVTAGFFMPFYTTNDSVPLFVAGTNVDLGAHVSIKLSKWASLDAVLSAQKVPTVSEEWQIQSGLMLSTSFNVIE